MEDDNPERIVRKLGEVCRGTKGGEKEYRILKKIFTDIVDNNYGQDVVNARVRQIIDSESK